MRLYHLTTPDGVVGILRDRRINATWPKCLSANWPGPRVAWLTSNPDPDGQGWAPSRPKTHRLTVEPVAQAAHPWPRWRKGRYLPAVQALERWGDPNTWYVVERAIQADEWVEVVELTTGRVLWPGS